MPKASGTAKAVGMAEASGMAKAVGITASKADKTKAAEKAKSEVKANAAPHDPRSGASLSSCPSPSAPGVGRLDTGRETARTSQTNEARNV